MGRRTFKEKEKIILFRCLTVKERRKKKIPIIHKALGTRMPSNISMATPDFRKP